MGPAAAKWEGQLGPGWPSSWTVADGETETPDSYLGLGLGLPSLVQAYSCELSLSF